MDKKKIKGALARRIIDLRAQRNWSQSDLAKACKKDQQSIQRLETGKLNPTYITIYEISKGFGITIQEFFDFNIDWLVVLLTKYA